MKNRVLEDCQSYSVINLKLDLSQVQASKEVAAIKWYCIPIPISGAWRVKLI